MKPRGAWVAHLVKWVKHMTLHGFVRLIPTSGFSFSPSLSSSPIKINLKQNECWDFPTGDYIIFSLLYDARTLKVDTYLAFAICEAYVCFSLRTTVKVSDQVTCMVYYLDMNAYCYM